VQLVLAPPLDFRLERGSCAFVNVMVPLFDIVEKFLKLPLFKCDDLVDIGLQFQVLGLDLLVAPVLPELCVVLLAVDRFDVGFFEPGDVCNVCGRFADVKKARLVSFDFCLAFQHGV
jgi:hypothetical protein